MKFVKIILTAIALVMAILIAMPAFIDSDVSFEREITINKPVAMVYGYVTNYRNIPDWSPWAALDPAAKNDFLGTPGQVESQWKWDGDPEKVGTGSMTLVSLQENAAMEAKMVFIKPRPGIAYDFWRFEAKDENTTVVVNGFRSSADTYFARIGNLMVESFIAPMTEKGLSKLKEILEAKPTMEELKKEAEVVTESL